MPYALSGRTQPPGFCSYRQCSSYGFAVYDLILRIRWQLGGPGYQGIVEGPLMHRPFPLYPGDLISFIFILSLLLFLVRRFP